MNAQAIKEVKDKNAQSPKETKVNTVDVRSSAGQQGHEHSNVQVVHQPHPSAKTNTSGGVLTGAAAAVATTLQSAKDAISKHE
ncbi:PREDICTED: POPTR_0007s10560g [Prunus dulcis]|uniref:PREDICTED: POPTR_0007s10560g n=2 Tax=Prunus dulcis TaxID=3755 RepID=A0A5E4ENF8_PRUDU|nr:PREDICTED: POPTR_0007s10560g [Prunus dulcis]